jgi:hypothetical protein
MGAFYLGGADILSVLSGQTRMSDLPGKPLPIPLLRKERDVETHSMRLCFLNNKSYEGRTMFCPYRENPKNG